MEKQSEPKTGVVKGWGNNWPNDFYHQKKEDKTDHLIIANIYNGHNIIPIWIKKGDKPKSIP